jgi:hypothetical protein
MLANVRGPKLLPGVKVNQRSMLCNIVGNIAKNSATLVDVSLVVLAGNLFRLPR